MSGLLFVLMVAAPAPVGSLPEFPCERSANDLIVAKSASPPRDGSRTNRPMLTTVLLASLLSAAKPTAAFAPKNRPYDAIHYRIEFSLKDPSTFENKLVMTLKAKKAPVSEIELDARGLEISDVKVGGEPATFK